MQEQLRPNPNPTPTPTPTPTQAVQEQLRQLQTSARLAEAAWKEERRAEVAASSQREKNLQAA